MTTKHVPDVTWARGSRLLLLLSLCLIRPARGATPAEALLSECWSQIRSSGNYKDGVSRLGAAAKEAGRDRDTVAMAHLMMAQCLVQLGDSAGATEKINWLARSFPGARIRPFHTLGAIVRGRMQTEWRTYVDQHPIYVKDFAWYELGLEYMRLERPGEALAMFEKVLRRVPPDPLPAVANPAILRTFRLHRRALEWKVHALQAMEFAGTRKAAAVREARAVLHELYPPAKWRRAELAAQRALADYITEADAEEAQRKASALERIRDLEQKARQQREAEAKARAKKLEAFKARDKERRRRYEEWKRRREADKAAQEKPEQATPHPDPPSPKPEQDGPAAPSARGETDADEH
jgi:hypothetical protein